MNIAVIFAGGTGERMHTKDRPKQFLMIHGKPIIVHTIEHFQNHSEIDGIIVACIESWIPYMEEMAYRYRLDKIGKIVPGGETGQMSIYHGLKAAEEIYGKKDNIVLIHDGVRPLIDEETITKNIQSVKKNGSAVTCAPVKETVILREDNKKVGDVVPRDRSLIAKAPQSFVLSDILAVEEKAIADGYTNAIDSCTLMRDYGHDIYIVEGKYENIKVTTPEDFYTFRAISDARENQQIFE
jgi:2-C-methyl-D-erythritol 4-phosphate cytidylyltransferase